MDLYKFKASLVYRVSSRTVRATQRNPVSKKKKKKDSTELSSIVRTRQKVIFFVFFKLTFKIVIHKCSILLTSLLNTCS